MIFIKKLYLVFILGIIYLIFSNNNINKIEIPKESIRFRVIANSNSEEDQKIKFKVKNNVEKLFPKIIDESSNIVEIEQRIKDNYDLINKTVKNTLEQENYLSDYKIKLGKNYFPEKEFYGVKYPKGEYESLVIELGSAKGDNWWCVLFPPLCLIEAEESTEVEYKVYIKEILQKYM